MFNSKYSKRSGIEHNLPDQSFGIENTDIVNNPDLSKQYYTCIERNHLKN